MSSLSVTLIDVGWGDSILVESVAADGSTAFALVDSNDTQTLRSSYIFLKRHFEKLKIDIQNSKPLFEFVLLSHAHADHAQGLKAIMRAFGTKNFYYPKSPKWAGSVDLIRYANRSSNVSWHQAIDNTHMLPNLGDVELEVIWPRPGRMDQCENNNSVVLKLSLGKVSFLLTGDAEYDVWQNIGSSIPRDTRFFKVPHHGSINGTLHNGEPAWLMDCPPEALLGISSHIRPFEHPDDEVIDLFENENRAYYRTDKEFHLVFCTDGNECSVKYSH